MYRKEEDRRAFIVDNLLIQISNAETLEDRRRILVLLVDRLDSMFVHALEMAYDLTPKSDCN
jgi:hypothetical protein